MSCYTTRTLVHYGAPALYNRFASRAQAARFARKQSRHELAVCVQIYDESRLAGMVGCYRGGRYLPLARARALAAQVVAEQVAFNAACQAVQA